MFLKLFSIMIILLNVYSVLLASDLFEDEQRLLDSMSIEELLNTDIATSFPLDQSMAPAVTTILTSEEIIQSGARTLHEVLEQVPGLHIYMSDLDSNSPKVSIRGLQSGYNSQVLFLLDGVKLNDLQNGHAGYSFSMPTSMINRIEIIRGPGSAVYGADAFSGVINIVSKKYENIVNQLGVRYGSFDTMEFWTNQAYDLGEVSLGFSFSYMKSDGDDDRIVTDAGGFTGSLDTRYETGYLHVDLVYREFKVNLLVEKSTDMGLGVGHKQNLDKDGHVNRDKILIDIKQTNTDWFSNTIVENNMILSYVNSESFYNPFNDPIDSWKRGNQYTKEYVAGFSTDFVYSGFDKHVINIKVGYEYSFLDPEHWKNFGPRTLNNSAYPALVDITDYSDAPYMLEQKRQSFYGVIQDEYMIKDDMIFTVGARYDYYDDIGSSINPRLAFVWQQRDDLTIKLMYGRAFRAPTFGELYYINNPAVIGNEDLDPETIDTYEIEFNHRAKLRTKLNFFYYEAKDIIDYIELPGASLGEKTAQNLKDQNAYGVELELAYPLTSEIDILGNYSYQHSEDADTKERIANVPVHQAFAQLQYKINKTLNSNLQYFYIGKRYRNSGDTRDDVDANSLVNLTIQGKNIVKNLDIVVSVRNLFDEDYIEPSDIIQDDYPMQSRSVFAELRYRF